MGWRRHLAIALAISVAAACGGQTSGSNSDTDRARAIADDNTVGLFNEGIAGDATCAELFSYRNSLDLDTSLYFDPRLTEIGCASSSSVRTDKPPSDTTQATTTTRPSVTTQSDALSMMESAFVGSPSRSTIKARIDRAMDLYQLRRTEENYSRAGSTLVALRREYGASEMEILDYMICSYVPGVSLLFHEAAAFAVTFLSVGDSC